MQPFLDRRTQRSERAPQALRFQLEHTRNRAKLEALVLCSDEGFEVASAGPSAICEELAAIAPFLGRGHYGMPLPPLLRGADVAIRPIRGPGGTLYLASVGGSVARDAHLSSSIRGVERILSTN